MRRPRIEINLPELDGILDSALEKPLSEDEHGKLKTVLHAMAERLTPQPRNSEKTADVVPGPVDSSETAEKQRASRTPRRGHGRNGAAAFTGARRVEVAHPELATGCVCPACLDGKVYPQKNPKPLLRFVGRAPIEGTVYELQRLRCNLCGEVFCAPEPEGVGPEKYDETVPSAIANLKYGHGIPFNRLESIQANAGVPLPASTQWELVQDAAEQLKPVYQEMFRQAAQGKVMHEDDTNMKVLKIERPEGDTRTGTFTTGVVSVNEDHVIALFLTGRQHAGENSRDVLQHRAKELESPVLMCDASSRNVPKLDGSGEILLANCLAHGRRHFTDVADNFPEECGHVLEMLGEVYGNDQKARDQGLNAQERLEFHQRDSGPVMEKLHAWLSAQLDEKRTEPNSGLGKAMRYLLRHWQPLTLFLRKAGAPLDNNLVERALKKAVLHRKNALFYRTLNGAQVGDLFMSLIHTCELNGVNPFDYLTELLRHTLEVQRNPAAWMPWNYKLALGSPG